ncbi:MAG: hypothetical protein HOQ22_07585 [Nocardioidaceae bacterium]|nr:hypothetical protein [Nocardioidaceae bacterium]NUS50887.1 hypothetical protein [Nocardioidaceae bacterium]
MDWSRVLWRAGWVLAAVMVVHVAALLVTGGAVTGPVSLRKPATFAETTWLLCWSVALTLPWLHLGWVRTGFVAVAVLAFGFGETAVMAIQAWRGVPSHYNFTTTFDAVLMRGGAGGLAFLMLAGLVVLLTGLGGSTAPASVRLGVAAGVGVLVVGCLVGFVMISNMSGVFQGAFATAFSGPQRGYLGPSAATVGHQYLLLRPHTSGGDLVLLHAVGVHGMLLLTVPAVLLARAGVPERRRLRLVGAMTGCVVVGLAGLVVQAFGQRPWASLSTPVLLVLVALAAGYAITLARSVLDLRSPAAR